MADPPRKPWSCRIPPGCCAFENTGILPLARMHYPYDAELRQIIFGKFPAFYEDRLTLWYAVNLMSNKYSGLLRWLTLAKNGNVSCPWRVDANVYSVIPLHPNFCIWIDVKPVVRMLSSGLSHRWTFTKDISFVIDPILFSSLTAINGRGAIMRV